MEAQPTSTAVLALARGTSTSSKVTGGISLSDQVTPQSLAQARRLLESRPPSSKPTTTQLQRPFAGGQPPLLTCSRCRTLPEPRWWAWDAWPAATGSGFTAQAGLLPASSTTLGT